MIFGIIFFPLFVFEIRFFNLKKKKKNLNILIFKNWKKIVCFLDIVEIFNEFKQTDFFFVKKKNRVQFLEIDVVKKVFFFSKRIRENVSEKK